MQIYQRGRLPEATLLYNDILLHSGDDALELTQRIMANPFKGRWIIALRQRTVEEGELSTVAGSHHFSTLSAYLLLLVPLAKNLEELEISLLPEGSVKRWSQVILQCKHLRFFSSHPLSNSTASAL